MALNVKHDTREGYVMHLAVDISSRSHSGRWRMPGGECVRPVGSNTSAIFVSGVGAARHTRGGWRPFQSLAGAASVRPSVRPRSTGADETSGDRCATEPPTHKPAARAISTIIFLIIARCARLIDGRTQSAAASATGVRRFTGAPRCTDRPTAARPPRPVPTTPANAPARSVKCRRVPLDCVVRSSAGVALSIIKRWL